MNKSHILLLIVLYTVLSCTEYSFTPQNGDLLFCVASNSAMSDAIVESTVEYDEIAFDHVGIYDAASRSVIEANPKSGVVQTPLSDFLASATQLNEAPGVIVMRVITCTTGEAEASVKRARNMIGLPYDWSFLPDNGKMYCSELIYECWRDSSGIFVFHTIPMSFRNEDGDMPDFWTELFERLGEPVPEGIPGTNPNDMAKEACLSEVFRYFK